MDASAPVLRALVASPVPAQPIPPEAGRLVLRVGREVTGMDCFLSRRAMKTVRSVADPDERRVLARALAALLGRRCSGHPLKDDRALLDWGGFLEGRGRLVEAAEVFDFARELRPDDPALTLHAARVARKTGEAARARALYERVHELDGTSGEFRRMAAVGTALLREEPEGALGRVLRDAVRAGDTEAAAVAQEARAGVRRAAGDRAGAVRDWMIAAARFADPADIGRIGHEVADFLVATGEPHAARSILLETLRRAHPEQAVWAKARLHAVSRALGDEVGRRRWADAAAPALTSLTPRTRGVGSPSRRSLRVARHLDRLVRR